MTQYHSLSEQIIQVLSNKTQVSNSLFYRVLVAYYLTKVAGTMRASIQTLDRGIIPINMYGINLAPSGFSKNYSTTLIENKIINRFKQRFLTETFPIVGEKSLAQIAVNRAKQHNTDPEIERGMVNSDFVRLGKFLFSFSEGTSPALKQMRLKLLMSNCGAINLEMDEIGSNLLANTEILTTFLELYDVGQTKQKLTKNTTDNIRIEDIDGCTPTNMMLFGTPDKLLDGSKVEEELISFLNSGFARRCFFGLTEINGTSQNLTPEQVFAMRTDTTNENTLDKIATRLENLADISNHNKHILLPKDINLKVIEYELECKDKAHALPELEQIRKTEYIHRYFKTLKLAGTYAFIEGCDEITEDHFLQAKSLTEDSGEALHRILRRDKPYVKLAKYLASLEEGMEVTQVDLIEDVPSFRGSASARNEQIILATAWGYKNNILVKKSYANNIDFFSAESLKETNLDKLIVSHSQHLAFQYQNEITTWDNLKTICQTSGLNWCVHHFSNGHRADDNVIDGFNLLVLDIDGGVGLNVAQLLLKPYKAIYYTTKSHQTEGQDRFRIVLPMNYTLKLDTDEYKEFMHNVFSWLPFPLDTATTDRPRKWASHQGQLIETDGELLDILPFIPNTAKADEHKNHIMDTQDLTNLERWFVTNTDKGQRSNQMIKYALLLVDANRGFEEIKRRVHGLNNKLKHKLSQREVNNTILKTVQNHINKRDEC